MSQDPLDSLIAPPDISLPTTPDPPHADLAQDTAAVNKAQAARVEDATSGNMTPPPSTQVPSSNRSKARTPTPPVSHISTPPPTVEGAAPSQGSRIGGTVGSMTASELENAPVEELRKKVVELQAAMHEAKMSAAHHKLQYQMLSQESRAAIERMAVEARMAQQENDVIQHAEQARAAATPVQQSPQDGIIPVHKDLYQRMVRDIQLLREANAEWKAECDQRDNMIERQDLQIASLTDKVTLMKERIRENREHLNKYRMRHHSTPRVESTPRSAYYGTPRGHASSQPQSQPFAALLQASEMVSQESARAGGRGTSGKKSSHIRNTHSTSSLPSTPQRIQKVPYSTPQGRYQPLKIPSTAPMPRTSALRTPDVYTQPSLPVSQTSQPAAPQSEGTVSASDDNDNDSEAETDIIEPDSEVRESQASRAASQMLRTSQEDQQAKRASFQGRGMLEGTGGDRLKQTKLFGSVRKNVDRRGGEDDQPPAKRARTGGSGVGLGIAGLRH